ncbi:MAG: sarcosine oxidase subunit delta [Alphaproteobacteria bacterium]|nr:sarcosine oxidase subunit delta [Alphaproteobacteria bacterium]
MLEINCPWCGPRPEAEFRCGGEIPIIRPTPDCTDREWAAYLHERTNPKGMHRERWLHVLGCGMWIAAIRSTINHHITRTGPLAAPHDEASS